MSANKQFDYFAAGLPIISDINCNYNLIKQYECGIVTKEQKPQDFADAIEKLYRTSHSECEKMGHNALQTA